MNEKQEIITSNLERWCAQLLELTYEVRPNITCIMLSANTILTKGSYNSATNTGLGSRICNQPIKEECPVCDLCFPIRVGHKSPSPREPRTL